MSVFSFRSYKEFLKSVTIIHKNERGFQAKLAKACGCQASYLSQVLNGKAEFIDSCINNDIH